MDSRAKTRGFVSLRKIELYKKNNKIAIHISKRMSEI